MKAHDFAKQLTLMAKVLRAGPNVELNELWTSGSMLTSHHQLRQNDIPVALNALVGLNEITKDQWLNLIEEFDFSIDIRSRDANRDIVGKLITYLAKNPAARSKLVGGPSKRKAGTSDELAKALNLLLK